jgi:hypothetical protein
MPENNVFNIESKQPSTPEEIEALKKRIAEQEMANEMLDSKVGQSQGGVKFDLKRPSEHLPEQATQVGISPQEAPKSEEIKSSDATMAFVDRLEKARSESERIAIINEVLSAAERGDLSAYEANEFQEKAA